MNALLISRMLLAASALAGTLAWAENGVTADKVVIGQSAALTGPAKLLGTEMRDGANAYFSQVNAAGGVNGRTIELISLDDGYEPEKAAGNTRKLIEQDKVFALFGYVGTPTSLASQPVFTEAKVPFFAPFTGADALRSPFNRYIFNIRAGYSDETEKIVRHSLGLNLKRIAVFYQNDSYGKAGLSGVEQALERRGMQLAATATVERNSTNVKDAVAKLSAVKPEAVIMVSAYKSCAAFIKEMLAHGASAQFYNVSFVGSRPLAEELGDEGAGVVISQVMPFPFEQVQPVVREYRAAMQKFQPKAQVSFTSLEGFIAAKVFVEGLRKAGLNPTRESLMAALEKIDSYDVGGFKVSFSSHNHSQSKFVDLTVIQKGGGFRN
ncbi:ABC transporter substrate-binding protein [Parachitinimonas caeni]|uniref:ABC transporter substrate-binding protein n=1 Tax=Parachitinimonas caeni TaxID=3031301 RepID=A0ABT7DYT1_9NEIS|nr:ABC transporter substrate-binding protein [Parachitinimonas caeni]MDK2124223.1 ABC transporter substrate-binding protein [Parachitinimonas caeni]